MPYHESASRPFFVLSKLAAFSKEEIERAKALNDNNRQRVILLTARELEPYFIYERTKAEVGIEGYGGTAEGMAEATVKIYFPGYE